MKHTHKDKSEPRSPGLPAGRRYEGAALGVRNEREEAEQGPRTKLEKIESSDKRFRHVRPSKTPVWDLQHSFLQKNKK